MRDISNKNKYVSFVLLAVLPFVCVMLILSPNLSGIQGTTYSLAGNDYYFDGEIVGDSPSVFNRSNFNRVDNVTYEGRFKGDLLINNNTGWVFCNGKVRFSGKLLIKDAELSYRIKEELHYECFTAYDYQTIKLQGDKGEMDGGFPVIFLGLFGSLLGIIIWSTWILMGFGEQVQKIVIIFSAFVTLWFTAQANSTIFITLMCFLSPVMLFIIAGVLLGLRKESKRTGNKEPLINHPFTIQIIFMLGALLFLISLVSVVRPDHFGNDFIISGEYYYKKQALNSVFYGLYGLVSSSFLLGAGLRKIRSLIKKENIERSVVLSE